MKLSKIKIAGFKSFVDPTEVLMPSNLIGVVGPNGCGKSNIIDAVRWVMGETSAKMLRGSSMTDVIFSGSSTRKPVSLATVELIFDNSDGQIKGEYANYNEISVKRQVNRDSQSFYFLNGSKCRKKDIVDLFLGTGLGPRSYSIIEQGMISNIVESKPEDLRGYIEEAAGVSKYRERRRETERRIKRTKENLERLDDLRTEVGKHIQHLQRQAKNAEKYTQLKDQFKLIKSEVLALRWQQWNSQAELGLQEVSQLKTAVEKAKSGQTDGEKTIEQHRQVHQTLNDENNKLQEQLYQINAEIGKIEQAIAHSKSLSERHQKDLANTETNHNNALTQLQKDQDELQVQEKLFATAKPKEEELSLQLDQAQELNQNNEEQQDAWRSSWDENNQKIAEHNRTVDVEKTRITSLETHIMRQSERLKSVEPSDNNELVQKLNDDLQQLADQVEVQQAKHDTFEASLLEQKDRVAMSAERSQQLRNQIDEIQQQLHQAKGRRGSLLTLQQAAQAQDNSDLKLWIEQNHQLSDQRLADLIEVDTGWESVVESVLQHRLQAWVTNNQDIYDATAGWEFGSMTTVHSNQGGIKAKAGTLAECVKGPDAVIEWFNQVKVCADAESAKALVSKLSAGESVVTQAGEWFGQNWVHINRGEQAEGFLLRQKELKSLEKQIETNETQLEALQEELENLKVERVTMVSGVEQLQLDVNMSHRKLSELNGLILNKQQLISREQQQNKEKAVETEQIRIQMAEDEAQVKQSRATLESAMNELAKFEQLKSQLLDQQQSVQQQYHQTKAQLSDISNQYY
ncbi:MAG: chromosome segregation protein SMC, partial [Marinicella sp.]